MRLRKLGNTGLTASEVSLGTAEIGLDYGFKGSPQYARPSVQDSIRLIHRAVDRGINWLDTARAYGNSEEVIGQALKDASPRPRIASKVIFENPVGDMDSASLRQWVFGSIESSLRALRVDVIDLLYIHNATEKLLRQTAIRDSLEEARGQGKIRLAGATCYGEEDALAVLKDPLFQVLQVPFSLLNQTMSGRVFPEAARKGVGVFVRSVFLRGVLTPQIEFLPERLAPLREQAARILQVLGPEVDGLAEAAVRFCLSLPEISSVLMGLKSEAELESNVSGLSRGPLPEAVMPGLAGLSLSDRTLVDPIHWQDLI